MSFEKLTEYLDSMPDLGIPGCDLRVWRAHQPVYAHWTGEADAGKPMTGKETYWFYSTTKVITMTASMQLIEQGRLALTDPVSKYLPSYGQITVRDGNRVRPAKNVMTIEHLMSMRGGLNYDCDSPAIRACVGRYGSAATTVQLAEALALQPLDFEPGTHYQYSLCHDVMAAIVEVVSGERFSEYVQRHIFDPLGIRDLTFHPTQDQIRRLAARYHWDRPRHPVAEDHFSLEYRLSDAHESGGAGLMGDVDSYMLLADALANGGVGKSGAQILKPETIEIMRMDRQSDVTRRDMPERFAVDGYSYGLGVRVHLFETRNRSPIGEFGWDSAAGAWVMMDPEHRLSAFFASHVLNGELIYSEYHPRIRDLIYESMGI